MTAISASRTTGSKRARCSRQASRSCSSKPASAVPTTSASPSDATAPTRRPRPGLPRPVHPGASYARSNPYLSPDSRWAGRRSRAPTFDGRTRRGLQARGEFLKGHSYEGYRQSVSTRMASSIGQGWDRSRRSFVVNGSTTTSAPRARGEATDAGDASAPAGSGHAAVELPAPAWRPAAYQDPIDRPSATYPPSGSLKRWRARFVRKYDGTTAWRRVAAGILLLVTLSLAAVVVATRVTTRSAVARAADNLEGARAAFYRLVDERAEFAASADTPDHRASALPFDDDQPGYREGRRDAHEMAEGYRQNLNAQFAIVTDSGRTSIGYGRMAGRTRTACAVADSRPRRSGRRIAPRHRGH